MVAGDQVRDAARLLNGTDGNYILGRGRRQDAVRIAVGAAVVAVAGIARRNHKQHRLRTRPPRQRVAHRRVVTGRRQVVNCDAIIPTVVGNQRVRQRRGFLKLLV